MTPLRGGCKTPVQGPHTDMASIPTVNTPQKISVVSHGLLHAWVTLIEGKGAPEACPRQLKNGDPEGRLGGPASVGEDLATRGRTHGAVTGTI